MKQRLFTEQFGQRKFQPGGAVAKTLQRQSEAFNNIAPPVDKILLDNGPITNGTQSITRVDLNAAKPINGQAVGKGIKGEDVIAIILVTGVFVIAAVVTIKIINSHSKKTESHKEK